MQQGRIERRRGWRSNVQVPLLIRRVDTPESEPFREERTANLSLAGAYFQTSVGPRYVVNDVVISSVSIPEPQTREFPFARLAGRGRIVRVEELASPRPGGPKPFGVAVEFDHDVTVLTAIPSFG